MKLFKTITLTAIASAISFSALAAKEITSEQAESMDLVLIGIIDTNSALNLLDTKLQLSKKVDAEGGRYYVINGAWEKRANHVTAEVYK